jgi:outer membrane receptor protein involved in Fe transport|tara:strand:- start:5850 stop:8243 length:2394 start_codon:yes stop_codon:yes gene_type:complete
MSTLTRTQKVTGVAAAVSAALAGYTTTQAQLEEIVVTATKKTENLQDIAGNIQAITESDLKKAQVVNMEDYAKLIPAMSYVNYTPGTGKIYFRGIADDNGTFISEESSALYIDEQPVTQAGMAVDVRMVDIARIEALAGPQGSLYGSSAQSGAIRIITNKPDTSEFAASVDMTLRASATSPRNEDSWDISGMVNVPISDNFAIRAVGFTAEDGGYVDVIEGVSARFGLNKNTDFNPSVVREDVNTFKTSGGRIFGKWDTDDGYIMAGLSAQNNHSDGYNYFDQSKGDLQRVSFYDEPRDDDWTQLSLTIEKDLGFAKLISATSYFDRDVFYQQDRTTYSMYFGTFCYYYNGYASTSRYCFQPVGTSYAYNDVPGWQTLVQWNSSRTQEFRLSNQSDDLDWVLGLFYQEREEGWDFETMTVDYRNSLGYANQMASVATYLPDRLPVAPTDVWWASYDRTNWETMAVFGEVNYRFNEKVELTVGGRFFDREADKKYWVENPKGALTADGVLPRNKRDNESNSDFVPKVSIKYNINDDMMVYALYSEGYRPGGVNRGRSSAPIYPDKYDADFLLNTEIGFKSTLADGNVRLNVTYFTMDWENYQIELVDPSNLPCNTAGAYPAPACGQPWQKVVANLGDATSSGLQLEVLAAINDSTEIGWNSQWGDSKTNTELADGSAPAGSRLPQVPEFKANLWIDKSFNFSALGATEGFARASLSYTGDTVSAVQPDYSYNQASFTIADVKVGIMGDDWELDIFVNNLTDERAEIAVNDWYFDFFFGNARQYTNRPREMGIRYTKRW